MSKRDIRVITCDGCQQNDYGHGIKIISSVTFAFGNFIKPRVNAVTLDLCLDCATGGCFICPKCKVVHKHEADCYYLQPGKILEGVF